MTTDLKLVLAIAATLASMVLGMSYIIQTQYNKSLEICVNGGEKPADCVIALKAACR